MFFDHGIKRKIIKNNLVIHKNFCYSQKEKEDFMRENIVGKRIKLKRPFCNIKTAEKIYSVPCCRTLFHSLCRVMVWIEFQNDPTGPAIWNDVEQFFGFLQICSSYIQRYFPLSASCNYHCRNLYQKSIPSICRFCTAVHRFDPPFCFCYKSRSAPCVFGIVSDPDRYRRIDTFRFDR